MLTGKDNGHVSGTNEYLGYSKSTMYEKKWVDLHMENKVLGKEYLVNTLLK